MYLPAGPQRRCQRNLCTRLRTPNITRSHKKRPLKKARSRRYPAQTISDADYADDLALLANTPAQAENLATQPRKGSTKCRPLRKL